MEHPFVALQIFQGSKGALAMTALLQSAVSPSISVFAASHSLRHLTSSSFHFRKDRVQWSKQEVNEVMKLKDAYSSEGKL